MAIRDIYLKIEQIPNYSTVEPEVKTMPPKAYRRDCMRNPGHEDTAIPQSEIDARRLTAIVYREYLDPNYLIPKPDKIVPADVNEPVFSRRVPGAVIYTQPGERLKIHVLNGDTMSHSMHVHGLKYGIDSDGSWPLGTQNTDGRRSDEICPEQTWTYTFDVTDGMIGAWPFHDHSRRLGESINRGLFGGIVVRPRRFRDIVPDLKLPAVLKEFLRKPQPPFPQGDPRHEALLQSLEEWAMQDNIQPVHPFPHPRFVIEVPLFFHFMSGSGGVPAFDSGPIPAGAPPFEVTFGAEGAFRYHCSIHPNMQAQVTVVAGGAGLATVNILSSPDMKFDPPNVTVGAGGRAQWINIGTLTHTVTEDAAGKPSYCFNTRSFVGNTPTILKNT